MRIKIHSVFIVILIVIIGMFSLVILKRKYNISKASKYNENETTYNEYIYYGPDSYRSWELGYEVAKKNGDWSKLPLSDKFREKYNEKDGILGNIEFDNIELAPYDNDDKYFDKYYFVNRNCYFVVIQGKAKTAYVYNLKYDDKLLNDVLIKDICYLTDEYGKELDVNGYGITNDNFKDSMDFLARGGNDEMSVAVTPNFHKKYPLFLDIFEHYSPLIYNHIEFVEEKSFWENKEAYFIVDSKLECKKRYYKVKFILDDRGYLDDVKVNKVNEEEYEYQFDPLGWDYWRDHISPILVLIYNNSNYNIIKSTENFKEKYNNENRVFDNKFIKDYQQYDKLLCLSFDVGKKYYYIDVKLLDDEETLDEIIVSELPYGDIPFDEAKELYLKVYSK